MNLENILKNSIENSVKLDKIEHILSNISEDEVLTLSDENNTLKIFTSQNDTFTLDHTFWHQISSNNDEGLATYTSVSNDSIKLLIDENIVDLI